MHDEMTMGVLAKMTGIAPRTIRYYVQIGLLPPPSGETRSARYSKEHLDRLGKIQALQAEGHSLDLIKRLFAGDAEVRSQDQVSVWTRISVAPGLEVHIDSSVADLSTTELRRFASRCRFEIGQIEKSRGKGK